MVTLGSTWTAETPASKYSIAANVAATSGTAVNVATAVSSAAANVAVQANYTLAGSATAGTGGTLCRQPGGSGHMYLGRVSAAGGAITAEIDYANAGVFTVLASTALPSSAVSGTLELEVFGTSLKLFRNGVLLLAVHNSSITAAGLFGLRGRSAHFDNVVVTPVTAQNAALPFTDMFTKPDNSELDRAWTEQVGAFYIVNGGGGLQQQSRLPPASAWRPWPAFRPPMSPCNQPLPSPAATAPAWSHAIRA